MNHFEIGLAFLEGLALIASPCILPVLPLILASSLKGGRRRPFGIILGFILTFSLFAWLARELVASLALNLDYIKYAALTLLTIGGILMLSERLNNQFGRLTQRWAQTGQNLSSNNRDGFISGTGIGALIGLVWTPCAGPILAVALVQIIRQQNNWSALWLVLAFAVGAGLPMLLIALSGRKLMAKLKFLTAHATSVRKVMGVLVIAAVVFIASGFNPQNLFADTSSSSLNRGVLTSQASQTNQASSASVRLQNPLDNPYPAPVFASSDQWFNTPQNAPLSIQQLKGKVVLVDFWTYSCINCIRTLPYIKDWYQKYHNQGLVIVGVHSPEFEFEKNPRNVQQAILSDGIKYPVAMDNNLDTWTNYNNRYWPAHYLIDKNGQVVYTSFGEGDYQVTENNIRVLLGLKDPAATVDRASSSSRSNQQIGYNPAQTPETYLGYQRAEAFNSNEPAAPNQINAYSLPAFLPANNWALSGKWQIEGQRIIASQPGAKLQLNFTAQHVYLVLGSPTKTPIPLRLKLNGKPLNLGAGVDVTHGTLIVKQHRLYELINLPKVSNGLLEIEVGSAGLEAYAFTFG